MSFCKAHSKRSNPDGRCPSSGPSSGPTIRSMSKRIQDWDFATDGKETFLYMFKDPSEDHKE